MCARVLVVDETGDALHTSTASETAGGGLGDAPGFRCPLCHPCRVLDQKAKTSRVDLGRFLGSSTDWFTVDSLDLRKWLAMISSRMIVMLLMQ